MKGIESRGRLEESSGAPNTYCSLLLQAATVLRMRYVEAQRDTDLSAVEADELAYLFDCVARSDPAGDQIEPEVAIALAHRIIDNDHPELSPLWPKIS